MAAAVPIIKLGGLLVRTLAKPLATSLKRQARGIPALKGSLEFVGQQAHWASTYLNIVASGHRTLKVCGGAVGRRLSAKLPLDRNFRPVDPPRGWRKGVGLRHGGPR
mmetsp:Transcript_28388/g.90832  ORF Transcript_28388/g.90832 Transcript_28388/m.90832 type:complete len:107 (+) Transcript_28388:94-414(+)